MDSPLSRTREGRPRRQRAATDRDIRHAARALLVDDGPEAVTLRAIARELGITAPALYRYYGSRDDLLEHLRADVVADLTSGGGVRAAFDAAGARSTLDTAVAATGAGGTVVNVAAWEQPVPFNPTTLLCREVAVVGSLAYTTADFERAVRIGQNRGSELAAMVTRTIALDDAAEWFDRLAEGTGDDVKVLVRPR
ncbi:hypothetical protein ACZ91_52700 [Streptomyces regensis]|nr:hypothetical protein ACZ91_52700 [Streptomyces regensis]